MVGAIEWGDIPTWIQAFSTTAAFAAAGYAVWLERQSRQRRDEEDAAQRERDRRAQASLVGVWLSPTTVNTPMGWRYDSLTVRNGSDLPVHSVTARFVFPGYDASSTTLAALPPGDTLVREIPGDRFGAEAGEARCLWISFVDTAGQAWSRSAAGELVEGERPPANVPAR